MRSARDHAISGADAARRALPMGRFRSGSRYGTSSRRAVARRWRVALVGFGILAAAAAAAAAADGRPDYRVENGAIVESLTGRPGSPERGERIVRDPGKATCLICHALPIDGEPDPGNIGPPLRGIADRYSAGQLRLRLVDPRRFNPDTVMPSYYAQHGRYRVAAEYLGRSIYSASEIEDVIAYLMTLTGE